jgi:hypothetical protein
MNSYYSRSSMYMLLTILNFGLKMHYYFYFSNPNIGYFNFFVKQVKEQSHIPSFILGTFEYF